MDEYPLVEVDLSTLKRAIGGGSYKKGCDYARHGAVRHVTWDAARALLHGTIRDDDGRDYRADVLFSVGGGRPARFARSRCSCPVRDNCKHVVALVHAVLPPEPAAALAPAAGPERASAFGQAPAPWAPEVAASPVRPVAIELGLTGETGLARCLAARLVQQDQRGGWVPGDLSWGNLDTEGYLADHGDQPVQLLRDLYRLYQGPGGREANGHDSWIDVSAITSPKLWPLLGQVAAAGLPLVYRDPAGGRPEVREATFHLDVTARPGGGLLITPVVRASDRELAVPVALIGANAQGAVCVDRTAVTAAEPASWTFWLARLSRPIPDHLHELAVDGRMEVSPDGVSAFCEQHYPWLSREADLISSDGSFVPPVTSGPDLVASVWSGPDGEVEVSWEWAYQVGGSQRRAPMEDFAPDGQYRSRAAEARLLARLDLPVRRYGLGFDSQPGVKLPVLAPRTLLTGEDAKRFAAGLIPQLIRQPGLIVEFSRAPASQRRAGAALRITAATDEGAGHHDWFDLDMQVTLEGHSVPFRDVFVALLRGDSYLLAPDRRRLPLDQPELRALARLIHEGAALDDPGPTRTDRLQAGLLSELSTLSVAGDQAPEWRERVECLLAGGQPSAADLRTDLPTGLGAELRPYQRDGFEWLAYLWKNRLGGILADEMGLGKTLQCLALLSHARRQDPTAAPFLIVAPTSVMANWVAEAAWVTPDLRVVRLAHTCAVLGRSLDQLAAGADAVVTSYDLLCLDYPEYAQHGWSGLLLDEAQQVKNRQSKKYQCVLRLRVPVKIAITGTPLENNLMELWSLLSITAPGRFPSPDRFFASYARPVEDEGRDEPLATLRTQIRPVFMRRTKKQVTACLPPRQEEVLTVSLHESHRHVYQTRLQRVRQDILSQGNGLSADRSTIIRSLTLLRRLSLHAGLVDDAYADVPSAKIDVLLGQLRQLADGGHRALVFSQFTGFLGKVRAQLDAEGMPYCYLDGGTRRRDGVIKMFKHGAAPVFLISLKAGGTGLNLTEADHCFLLDPWWNPATEAQAIGRVHRIGQTRPVRVCRLVARETVEEKVLALQTRKAQLASSVMKDDGRAFGRALQADDLRGLLL